MASHPRNSIPACLLLTLFLAIRLTQAETFQRTDCKYQKCQEASAICAAMTPAAEAGDLTDCQIKHCMQEKKKCEEPLNKYLSEEEVCEGNEFNDVEMDCLLKLRTSLEQLTDCAYDTCFQNVTRCLYDHHHDLAINPAKKLLNCCGGSNVAPGSSTVGQGSSNVAQGSTNVPQGSSNVAQGSSNVAQSSTNVAQSSTNVAQSSSNVAQSSSNVAHGSSNVAQSSSNVAQSSSNVTQGSSNADVQDFDAQDPTAVELSDEGW
ncbi:unnamed protein product [Lampetra planeri]